MTVVMVAPVAGGSLLRDFRAGDGAYRTADKSAAGSAGDQGSRPRSDGTTGDRAAFTGSTGDQGRRRGEPDGEQTGM